MIAAVLVLNGCGELTYHSEPVRVADVAVVPASLNVKVGSDASVQVRVLDRDGGMLADRTVSVSSTDPRVAMPLGLTAVRAVAEGAATIRYTADGVTTTMPVTVISAATRISLYGSRGTLYLGDSLVLTASAYDANGRAVSTYNLRWTSLAPANATVSSTGVVRGIALGRAVIAAQLGAAQATTEYYVTDPLWWIRIAPSTSSLAIGDSLQLSATAVDSWGFPLSGRAFTWRATSPNIVDVTSTGLVKARGLGWGDIAVSTGAVVVKSSMHIIPQPLASISIMPAAATLRTGNRLQFAFTMAARNGKPTTADGRWVRWSSGYSANIDNYGMLTARSQTSGSSVCVSVDDQTSCANIIILP